LAADNLVCGWQNRLASLPDPLRNGLPTVGIAGQIFLLASNSPVDPNGELTVRVTDASPRPPGQSGPVPEEWHFTNASLKNLRLADEHFGQCLIIFLPWPDTWRDVTRVRFNARYDQPNGMTLYAKEAVVTLDFTPSPNGMQPGSETGGAVSNPTEMLKQARAAQSAGRQVKPWTVQPPMNGVQQTGSWGPPPQGYGPPMPQPQGYAPQMQPQQQGYYGPPPGYYAPPTGMMTGPSTGGVQPVAVPFRPPGTELATQGPREIVTQYPPNQ
jgi:hypothetical protein